MFSLRYPHHIFSMPASVALSYLWVVFCICHTKRITKFLFFSPASLSLACFRFSYGKRSVTTLTAYMFAIVRILTTTVLRSSTLAKHAGLSFLALSLVRPLSSYPVSTLSTPTCLGPLGTTPAPFIVIMHVTLKPDVTAHTWHLPLAASLAA